jgi:hypothetical protein|tara:strand:+ start:1050 stop:1307 length:258 start_codon:yes stop_codon:yes gene_type:complete
MREEPIRVVVIGTYVVYIRGQDVIRSFFKAVKVMMRGEKKRQRIARQVHRERFRLIDARNVWPFGGRKEALQHDPCFLEYCPFIS